MPDHVQGRAPVSLTDVAGWVEDVHQALDHFERRVAAGSSTPPSGWLYASEDEVRERIQRDKDEAELSASFHALASVERVLRERLADALAADDALEISGSPRDFSFTELCDWWRESGLTSAERAFSQVKGWVSFRDWVAHGRAWDARLPTRIASFHRLETICRQVLEALPGNIR